MLIGIQLYDSDAIALRRQRRAVAALSRLTGAGVEAVNVQFREGPSFSLPGIETVAALARDSISATGAKGKRKPLAREMFDVLASRAAARGHRHFAFINADIVVMPEAIREVDRHGLECYVISRSDVDDIEADAPPRDLPMTAGLDMFVVSTSWWMAGRGRFRDYAIGETCWDCVYAAMMMCYSKACILNRDVLILHERHAPAWHEPTPASRYNGMLAALDSRYFSLWVSYWQQLETMRARQAPAADERALQQDVFVWRPSVYESARQLARSLRAKHGYRRLRAGWTSQEA